MSVLWQASDKNIFFNFPFIGNYEDIDFYGKQGASFARDGSGSLYYPNGSLLSVASNLLLSGYNSWDNTTKEINFVVNGNTGSSLDIES